MSDLILYGEVGWEIKASDVTTFLASNTGEDVTVRLNSGGGDVYEGIAIMNALRGHDGKITIVVEGLAASAASVIACGGGDHIIMRPNAELMIHEAWSHAQGNAAEMTKRVNDLNRASENIAAVYAARAGGEPNDWRVLMQAETWYTAEEALAAGLVDEVQDARRKEDKPVASYAPRMVAHYKYSGRRDSPSPHNLTPDGEKENTMSLKALATELGFSEDDLKSVLVRLKNEVVPITGEVDVTYPEGTTIAPTEKVTVQPVFDGADSVPAGVTFAIGDIAEGYVAEVDEAGAVSITAPSGAEVGATADFTVLVNEVVVPLQVTVRSLSEQPDDTTEPEVDPAAPVPEAPASALADTVTVPRAHFEWLNKAAALNADVQAKVEAAEREAEVDKWIKEEGRFSVALRARALADYEADPAKARETWGGLPKNTIPRHEVGYGRDVPPVKESSSDDLRKQPNPFPKPKF